MKQSVFIFIDLPLYAGSENASFSHLHQVLHRLNSFLNERSNKKIFERCETFSARKWKHSARKLKQ